MRLQFACRLIFILAWLFLPALPQAHAQDARTELIATISESLVHIRITGTSAADSSVKTAEGTGFLVSDDGFILTNYHLLNEMKGVDTDTIKITVSFKQNNPAFRIKALPINGNEIIDLLLLKVPEGNEPYKPLQLGSSEALSKGDTLFTLGFPAADDPEFQPDPLFRSGDLSSRSGPTGSLWTVSIPMTAGQSGSPIFHNDGTVVGVARAVSETDANSRYMIPIHFADSILAHLRVAALQKQLEAVLKALGKTEPDAIPLNDRLKSVESNITDLRKFYEWSASMSGDDVKIEFTKLVGGEPLLRGIEPQIKPIAINLEDKAITKSKLKLKPQPGPSAEEFSLTTFEEKDSSGSIIVTKIKDIIATLESVDGDIKSIPELEIRIVPVLSDGTKLKPQILVIKTHLDD